jgi:hypothetical protein
LVGALRVFGLVVRCSLIDCRLPPRRCMSPSGPAFIVIDDKGNDFFKDLNLG